MRDEMMHLDRGRKIALEGRPYEVDWMTLLGAGLAAVQRGRANEGPLLSTVMWEGADPAVVTPCPVVLDHPLIRRWLNVEEQEAMTYLREQWGIMRNPSDGWGREISSGAAYERDGIELVPGTVDEALEMLGRRDCASTGDGQHKPARVRASYLGEAAYWTAGPCPDCLRAVLFRLPLRYRKGETPPLSWSFFDQEASG